MKRFRILLAALLLPLALLSAADAQQFKRGLNKLTPQQKQARAMGPWHKAAAYPPNWSIISPKNSMFLNDRDGDCVLAGECVNINAHWFYVTGQPVIISDAEVQSYGGNHGILNGADLLQVVGMMSVSNSDGLTYSSGTDTTMYCDGIGTAVNYQSRDAVCSACYSCSGSLKVGCAGDDLQRVGAGNKNGWYLGSSSSNNIDHNTEILGYGTASYCYSAMSTAFSTTIPVPQGVDPNQFGYIINTWSTVGFVNAPVVETSGWCDEIDMRTPTSVAIPWTNVTPPNPPGPRPPTRRGVDLAAALVQQYQEGDDADKAEVLSYVQQGEAVAAKYKAKHALAK